MSGQIKAVERLAPGGLEHQRGPPRSRTSSKSGLADAPSSSSLSPYSYARRLRLTDVFTAGSTAKPRADRGRRHPAICCGRDVRRPPNTSKATILTSAEPREWFHLPDSADRPIGAIERLATVKSSLRAREIFERPSTEFQRSSERAELILLANLRQALLLNKHGHWLEVLKS